MKILIQGAVMIALGVSASACKVTKTQDAQAPTVSIKASGGQLPAYDVKGPDVKVGSKTETIKVPTIHVTTPNDKK